MRNVQESVHKCVNNLFLFSICASNNLIELSQHTKKKRNNKNNLVFLFNLKVILCN